MLRIDPAAPPLWRTPHSLQFGLDPVLVLLDPVPPGADQVVHALTGGIGRAGLAMVAKDAGLDDLDDLLHRLRPVLQRRDLDPPALRVLVDGPADLAAPLRPWLAGAGEPPDLAVIIAHHVIPPAATVRYLRDDLPHVAVVFGDQSATVGPSVVPGVTPCLHCADEYRLENPHWRALAAQLLHRGSSRTATSTRVRFIAAALLGDALERLRDGAPSGLEAAALRIAPDGSVSRVPRPWHERCSCHSLLDAHQAEPRPLPPGPAPRGTGTGAAPLGAAPASAPTTAEAGLAPA